MGYRSQVRCLIYGDPDKVCHMVAAHQLAEGPNVFEHFSDSIKRYKKTIKVGEMVPAPEGSDKPMIYEARDVEIEVIDLYGDDWKWYDSDSDVQAWTEFMHQANEFRLSREFVRIGEDDSDVDVDCDVLEEHDQCGFLGVNRTIRCDFD